MIVTLFPNCCLARNTSPAKKKTIKAIYNKKKVVSLDANSKYKNSHLL
jgi:hypothetical protein